MNEEVEEELDVLRAIYGDDTVRVVPGESEVKIEIDLLPRVEQGAVLVSATVSVALPSGYPKDALPKVHVERSRGLGDVAIESLLRAARDACNEHGLQEIGCVSHLLEEVSIALDEANDTSECNICLGPCCRGEKTVRPSCDHVFHVDCIGRWASMKAAEAEAAANEASTSSFAERDALRREVDEAVERESDASLQLSRVRKHAEICTRLRDIARVRRAGGSKAEELEVSPELEERLLNTEGEEIALEELVENARLAKEREKSLSSEERRAQSRLGELRSKLEQLETALETEAAARASAALPCPVCRAPIPRSLLPPPAQYRCEIPSSSSSASASVAALPEELRERVYKMQAQHHSILELRRQREVMAAEAARDTSLPENTSADHVQDSSMMSASPHEEVTHKGLPNSSEGRGGNVNGKGHRVARDSQREIRTDTAPETKPSVGWDQGWAANEWNGTHWSSGTWSSNRGGQDSGWWSSQGAGGGGKANGRGGRWRT